MGYNLARNPIGTVHNASLASALGEELHPPILRTLAIHGGQVKIYIYILTHSIKSCGSIIIWLQKHFLL